MNAKNFKLKGNIKNIENQLLCVHIIVYVMLAQIEHFVFHQQFEHEYKFISL